MLGHFLLIMKQCEQIKRYQTSVNLVPREVSKHTDFVTKISYSLAEWEEKKFGNIIDWKKLMGSATFHDGIESISGDILSPTKRRTKSMPNAIKDMEEDIFDNDLIEAIPKSWEKALRQYILNPKDGSIEGNIIAAADIIDVIYECRDEVLRGNKILFEDILKRSIKKLVNEVEIGSVRYFVRYPLLYDLGLDEYIPKETKEKILKDPKFQFSEIEFENKRKVLTENFI